MNNHLVLILCGCLYLSGRTLQAEEIITLPDTEPLTWTDELHVRLMDGAHRYIERRIDQSVETRQQYWNRDFSSPEAYEASIKPNRDRFTRNIGIVDERVPVKMEHAGDVGDPAVVAETGAYDVYQVRWSVLDTVTGEGLLVKPRSEPVGHVIAIPDADQTPEQLMGLTEGVAVESQFARRLAENGYQVIVPALLDRTARWSGNYISSKGSPLHPHFTNQPHREWIHRMAYMMGRNIMGYEVQKMMSLVDWLKQQAGEDARIGIAGYAEGGMIAMYTAAVDTRIDATLVSGYFKSRQELWKEPIYRLVWALLHEFGDAEIASLIAPRGLVVEYSEEPKVDGPPDGPPTAAPGRLETPDFDNVRSEFERLDTLVKPGFQARHLVYAPGNRTIPQGSSQALDKFSGLLGIESPMAAPVFPVKDLRANFDPADRQKRQVEELEQHVQWLIPNSDHVRSRVCRERHPMIKKLFGENQGSKWAGKMQADTYSAEKFGEQSGPLRKYFWEEILGKFEDPTPVMNPRSRYIRETDKWKAYDVVLDVWPDVFAWGMLAIPKDLKPGEKRPVMVMQHGHSGVPNHMFITDPESGAYSAYQGAGSDLADRGFIVFAPHNLYILGDRFRFLDKKANLVKGTLFTFILAQHKQILTWLKTLPYVDGDRIGFYGLSYGGETAVRVPPILTDYALSICSADFNDWTRKVATCHDRYSFMFHGEWEMFYFNLGSTFDYAEMAYLMIPRPFMAERGHHDTVSDDTWSAKEFADIRWMYDQLGIGDRTDIEFHNGGHTMQKQGTFDFIHKHLNWPKPEDN
jgi:dienelactone hydrolase